MRYLMHVAEHDEEGRPGAVWGVWPPPRGCLYALVTGVLAVGCGAPRVESVAPDVAIVDTAPTPPAADAGTRSVLSRLLDPEAEIAARIDVAALRAAGFGSVAAWLYHSRVVHWLPYRDCGLAPLNTVDEVAVSLDVDEPRSLLAVRFGQAVDMLACARSLWPEGEAGEIEGRAAWLRPEVDHAAVMVAPEVAVFGSLREVGAALRREGASGEAAGIVRHLWAGDGAVAEVAADAAWNYERARVVLQLEPGRLRLVGEARYAEQLEGVVEDDRRMGLGEVMALRAGARAVGGAEDALARDLGGVKLSLDGLDLGVRGELSLEGAGQLMAATDARGLDFALRDMEAKSALSTVAQIARYLYATHSSGAMEPDRVMCRTAVDLPARIPPLAGTEVGAIPATDPRVGWRCLELTEGFERARHGQLSYRQGSGYKGPARGGPDPGPDGFEVAYEVDLDGDGVTGLYTVVGRPDAKRRDLKLEPMFIVSESAP